jgi:hypothetical protein
MSAKFNLEDAHHINQINISLSTAKFAKQMTLLQNAKAIMLL